MNREVDVVKYFESNMNWQGHSLYFHVYHTVHIPSINIFVH
jgi:hypothetical protein